MLGQPVDGKGEVTTDVRHSIHRSAPAYVDLDTTRAIFETGIKVVDSCSPYLSVVGRLACLVAPVLGRRSSLWSCSTISRRPIPGYLCSEVVIILSHIPLEVANIPFVNREPLPHEEQREPASGDFGNISHIGNSGNSCHIWHQWHHGLNRDGSVSGLSPVCEGSGGDRFGVDHDVIGVQL